ncbi:MAG: Na+/H+ antiporter NhaA [Saprospiraceae bacterium]|nr:Na+/H+ antiporter NhaA [Candidatus Vicinibacter affinis]
MGEYYFIFYTIGTFKLVFSIWNFWAVANLKQIESSQPYSLCYWWCRNVVFYATIRNSSDDYWCFISICNTFGDGGEKSPSYILQHWLHKPVAFFILPLFALANTCIPIQTGWETGLTLEFLGANFRKPIGIFLALRLSKGPIPADIKGNKFRGLLAGIDLQCISYATCF